MMLHACATTVRYGSFSNPHNLGKEDYKILAYSISMINVGPTFIIKKALCLLNFRFLPWATDIFKFCNDYFWQLFHALCLFPALCLFRTLEYVSENCQKMTKSSNCMKMKILSNVCEIWTSKIRLLSHKLFCPIVNRVSGICQAHCLPKMHHSWDYYVDAIYCSKNPESFLMLYNFGSY